MSLHRVEDEGVAEHGAGGNAECKARREGVEAEIAPRGGAEGALLQAEVEWTEIEDGLCSI
jgi:hypothetical protein